MCHLCRCTLGKRIDIVLGEAIVVIGYRCVVKISTDNNRKRVIALNERATAVSGLNVSRKRWQVWPLFESFHWFPDAARF